MADGFKRGIYDPMAATKIAEVDYSQGEVCTKCSYRAIGMLPHNHRFPLQVALGNWSTGTSRHSMYSLQFDTCHALKDSTTSDKNLPSPTLVSLQLAGFLETLAAWAEEGLPPDKVNVFK